MVCDLKELKFARLSVERPEHKPQDETTHVSCYSFSMQNIVYVCPLEACFCISLTKQICIYSGYVW